ncbi:Neprilysin-11 [Orchesella cincta]|uniref:Neprilysin-11 n=1 Tax=Orchesella cincta TaxID=48709 RepID=A0A1D2N2C2_ORCCI|nr:Neprilysin-11 [Orchesella cincta]
MHFLELPIRNGGTTGSEPQRSSSQTNFFVEDDARSDISDASSANIERKGSTVSSCNLETESSTNKSSISSSLYLMIPTRILTCSLGFLALVVLILVGAVAALAYLYFRTFPPYEICRTKECTRTATLFLRTMDDTIDPCEDFHKFACGNWITDTSVVANVASFDHTTIMRNRIIGHLRELTESITRNDIEALQQLKIIYNSCVDLESIERAGVGPMIDLIQKLIDPQRSVAKTLAMIHRETGQDYVFDISISPSYYNTSVNQIFIDQPDLPIPKAAFQYAPNIVSAYETLIKKVLSKIGHEIGVPTEYMNDMKMAVRKISAFDQLFALSSTDTEDKSKPEKANLLTLKELNRLFSNRSTFGPENATNSVVSRLARDFNWTEYVETLFEGLSDIKITDEFVVNVIDLNYIDKLADILVRTPPDELHMYVMWQLLYSFGKDISREFRSYFDSFSAVIDGTESTPNRRTECVNILDKSMPFAMTHKYIQRYVKKGVIEEARELVSYIVQSFKGIVLSLDWMDDNTKARALLKADKVRAYLGYPKWLPDPEMVNAYYEGLKFTSESFFSNMLTVMKWTSEKQLREFSLPVDLTWTSSSDSPAEADCFYDDELNAVTFPSGFLQEPFIGMGLKAIDYGALGSVMGHELTHGFDTEGRYSDETGRLNSWWSLNTLEDFVGKADCFINQYDGYWFPELGSEPGPNNTVNGRRTLAENIADNGGVREALEAYRHYIKVKGKSEPRLPGLEKYTPEQIFFLSFAQSWCSYMNPSALMDMIETDLHSPPKYRILGPLSNFKEFSNIWQCSSSARMNPDKTRCVLWG